MITKELAFKEFILLDRKNQTMKDYFLPAFQEIECLTANCRFNFDHSELEQIELDLSQVKDRTIFAVKGAKNQHIIVRLDLLESMLRRNANGFLVKEVIGIGGK